MTNPTLALAELAEKGVDVDVLHQMVQFMANRLMELDVEARCGAGYDEKAPATRLNSRNGILDLTAAVGHRRPTPMRAAATPIRGHDGCAR